MSRAAELASLRMLSCALGARLFPPPKWAGLFPSAAYRRSAPPQSAAGRLTPCELRYSVTSGRFCGVDEQADFLFPRLVWAGLPLCGVGCFGVAGRFCGVDEQTDFLFTAVGCGQAQPLQVEMFRCCLENFATQKASVNLISRWPFLRAMRPVAEWRSESATRQGTALDRRAARPVAERR